MWDVRGIVGNPAAGEDREVAERKGLSVGLGVTGVRGEHLMKGGVWLFQ